MTIIREIEQKISDAFQGGEILTRELRLTPLTAGDGAWYEISVRGAEN